MNEPAAPAFFVGQLPIYGNLILAPMDGYSDLPFRLTARRLGSAMSYTEFINAIDVVHRHPHLSDRLRYAPEERPLVYQVFDDDVERLIKAVQILRRQDPDIIDINMGCSAASVSNRGAGAGLLRAPEKIAQIFSRLSSTLDIPVTGKIRLGWDDSSRNHIQIAKIIEDNGGKLIAVHARTRKQAYTGCADWDAIAEVKASVSIPVIGNGDVNTVDDMNRMFQHTGCDAVMIGRAARGNPWIFSRLDRHEVPTDMVWQTVNQHLESQIGIYGLPFGLITFRKHAVRYLSLYPIQPELRYKMLTTEDPAEFLSLASKIIYASNS